MTTTSPKKRTTLTLEENARLILSHTRRVMQQELPEFLPVIWLMKDEPCDRPDGLWTDGEKLYYHPERVVQDYLADRTSVARQLFHILAHGLLGHYSKRRGQEEALFDAVADIKAVGLTRCLHGAWLPPKLPRESRGLLDRAEHETLEACYLALDSRSEAARLVRDARPLRVDDHTAWSDLRTDGASMTSWTQAAQQVAANMARSRWWGHVAGEFMEIYSETETSSVSYTEFLRRFVCINELQRTDPDSINRIWYHVGLEMTGDIPFVEPDELMEDAEQVCLAVALDTSGSCCGMVMEGFLQELLAILRDSGGPGMSITLIQCDAEVQSVRELSGEDTAAELMESFRVDGGGGTDFRPVFAYLHAREAEGETIRGLLFLSDGCGDFPETPPPYPVAFLFPKGEEFGSWMEGLDFVPSWVTKVSIRSDGRLEVVEGESI